MAPSSRKSASAVQALLLTHKAEVKEVSIPSAADGTITMAAIQTILKKKEAPEILGTYKYKSQGLFLFGYTTGKAGTENKHELPPPHDSVLCFGDILLLCGKDQKAWNAPIPFKSTDYEAFYTKAFGGFEELGSDEEEEEEVVEEAEVAEEVEEVEEADEADDAEEDGSDDEEGVAGDDGGDADADAEVVAPVRAVTKKKKRVTAAEAACAAGAAQVYSSYLYVPATDELAQEPFDSPYNNEGLVPNRRKVLVALGTLFKGMLDDGETQQLERCIYNGTIREATQRHIGKAWAHNPFVEMYHMFAKHISANFHPSAYVGNTELFTRYKAGEVTFREISEMDTYQLFEERWKESFMQQQIREKRQLEGNKSMATDQFLCMRCHKRECTYYEMQTRSADEPMTIFITCLNCGKHWRQ